MQIVSTFDQCHIIKTTYIELQVAGINELVKQLSEYAPEEKCNDLAKNGLKRR